MLDDSLPCSSDGLETEADWCFLPSSNGEYLPIRRQTTASGSITCEYPWVVQPPWIGPHLAICCEEQCGRVPRHDWRNRTPPSSAMPPPLVGGLAQALGYTQCQGLLMGAIFLSD